MYRALFLLLCVVSFGLGQTPEATVRAREVLRVGIADKEPNVRREVAIAMSLIRSSDASVEMLKSLTKDKDHLVRQSAIDSLGELGDKKLISVIQPALDDEVPEVVFAAARALFRLGSTEGERVLLAVYEKEEKAKSGLIKAKMRSALRRLKTPQSALFFAVQQGAGFLPVPGVGEGISAVGNMLNDANFSPRATALLIMSTSKSQDFKAALDLAFGDDDWSVRAAAIQLTIKPENARWRPRLVKLLDDSNRKVRYRAAAVHLRLNPKSK